MSIATTATAPGLSRAGLLALGLGATVLARSWATVSGVGDALVLGLAFGLALGALALAAGLRLAIPPLGALVVGSGGGAALVVLAVLISRSGPALIAGQSSALLPWALVTVLVATAEEWILRGVLFDLLDRHAGTLAAVAVTSAIFALMHVPLYGWHVVPLDLGVGLWLAGLRLLTGSVAAPAVAHVLADLATWWL